MLRPNSDKEIPQIRFIALICQTERKKQALFLDFKIKPECLRIDYTPLINGNKHGGGSSLHSAPLMGRMNPFFAVIEIQEARLVWLL